MMPVTEAVRVRSTRATPVMVGLPAAGSGRGAMLMVMVWAAELGRVFSSTTRKVKLSAASP